MREVGPDLYHSNLTTVPAGRIKAAGCTFVILKVSQGVSYPWADSWFPPNAAIVRNAGLHLGGYHMLDGSSGTGAEQAAYFLSKYKPQPGDIVPCMDFEASGRGSASIQTYRAMAVQFIQTVHSAGFDCMIYGHADVKAAWSDWEESGADYWWVPGDSPHNDIGPRGPDLWQYGPYTLPPGLPKNPSGLSREDVSVVMTQLPLIGEGDDMTPEDKAALKKAGDSAQRFEDYLDGEKLAVQGKNLPAKHSDAMASGFQNANTFLSQPKPGQGGDVPQHKHVPGGVLAPPGG